MTKPLHILIPILSATILTGCDFMLSPEQKDYMKLSTYEYQVELPPETTPAQLSEIEKNLIKDGYKLVAFRDRYTETWTPVLIGRKVYATKNAPPSQPLPPTTPSTTR